MAEIHTFRDACLQLAKEFPSKGLEPDGQEGYPVNVGPFDQLRYTEGGVEDHGDVRLGQILSWSGPDVSVDDGISDEIRGVRELLKSLGYDLWSLGGRLHANKIVSPEAVEREVTSMITHCLTAR